MNIPSKTNTKTPSCTGEGLSGVATNVRTMAGVWDSTDLGSLPRDPFMLMSAINMKLRDQYASLDALCDDLGVCRANIDSILRSAGFEYNEQQNKYW